jgi:hypothetical protein
LCQDAGNSDSAGKASEKEKKQITSTAAAAMVIVPGSMGPAQGAYPSPLNASSSLPVLSSRSARITRMPAQDFIDTNGTVGTRTAPGSAGVSSSSSASQPQAGSISSSSSHTAAMNSSLLRLEGGRPPMEARALAAATRAVLSTGADYPLESSRRGGAGPGRLHSRTGSRMANDSRQGSSSSLSGDDSTRGGLVTGGVYTGIGSLELYRLRVGDEIDDMGLSDGLLPALFFHENEFADSLVMQYFGEHETPSLNDLRAINGTSAAAIQNPKTAEGVCLGLAAGTSTAAAGPLAARTRTPSSGVTPAQRGQQVNACSTTSCGVNGTFVSSALATLSGATTQDSLVRIAEILNETARETTPLKKEGGEVSKSSSAASLGSGFAIPSNSAANNGVNSGPAAKPAESNTGGWRIPRIGGSYGVGPGSKSQSATPSQQKRAGTHSAAGGMARCDESVSTPPPKAERFSLSSMLMVSDQLDGGIDAWCSHCASMWRCHCSSSRGGSAPSQCCGSSSSHTTASDAAPLLHSTRCKPHFVEMMMSSSWALSDFVRPSSPQSSSTFASSLSVGSPVTSSGALGSEQVTQHSGANTLAQAVTVFDTKADSVMGSERSGGKDAPGSYRTKPEQPENLSRSNSQTQPEAPDSARNRDHAIKNGSSTRASDASRSSDAVTALLAAAAAAAAASVQGSANRFQKPNPAKSKPRISEKRQGCESVSQLGPSLSSGVSKLQQKSPQRARSASNSRGTEDGSNGTLSKRSESSVSVAMDGGRAGSRTSAGGSSTTAMLGPSQGQQPNSEVQSASSSSVRATPASGVSAENDRRVGAGNVRQRGAANPSCCSPSQPSPSGFGGSILNQKTVMISATASSLPKHQSQAIKILSALGAGGSLAPSTGDYSPSAGRATGNSWSGYAGGISDARDSARNIPLRQASSDMAVVSRLFPFSAIDLRPSAGLVSGAGSGLCTDIISSASCSATHHPHHNHHSSAPGSLFSGISSSGCAQNFQPASGMMMPGQGESLPLVTSSHSSSLLSLVPAGSQRIATAPRAAGITGVHLANAILPVKDSASAVHIQSAATQPQQISPRRSSSLPKIGRASTLGTLVYS